MKILFWSEQEQCGLTSNMIAIAGRLSQKYQKKCILIQTKQIENQIETSFLGKQNATYLKEDCEYFLPEGMDYLMMQRRITPELVEASLKELIPHHLFLLPAGKRRLPQRSLQKEKFYSVLDCLEQKSDIIFLDCGVHDQGIRTELIKQSDVVVVNFKQSQSSFDQFFSNFRGSSRKFFYLIGNYQPESIYNKNNMHRLYRIPKERFGVVPYNPRFQNVCEKGRLGHYVEVQNSFFLQERDQLFLEGLDVVSNAILEVAKYE